ncbi:MAG: hypothetical protein HC803_06920 [Saprospiraceae bacterium]|nr:hypothetical protein [Saprospiraceae bacterium]
MIDRFDNIADLHEEVLNYLLETKKEFNLYFTLRSSKDLEGLQKGWWFEGDENHLKISFDINDKFPKNIGIQYN